MDKMSALIPPEAIREFLEKSWTHLVAPPETSRLIDEAVRWFLNEFLPEPDAYKDQWTFPHKSRPKERGWVVQDGERAVDEYGQLGQSDQKVYLHFYRDLPDKLRGRGVDFSRHQKWLETCEQIYRLCSSLVQEFALALEKNVPDCQIAKLLGPQSSGEDNVLRLLTYRAARADNNQVIGQQHRDKSALALDLWESGPGLAGGLTAKEKSFTPLASEPNQPMIHAGVKLEQLTQGRIKGLWHRVVHSGERYHQQAIRVAVIFFAHPDGVKLAMPTHLKDGRY